METPKFTFEEILARDGKLTYTNVGGSMLPLLRQGKDLFTVSRKGMERCKKGDVVLYRRGKDYVLHRVVEVRPDDYVILGDNCAAKEYGIRDADILGVMTGYVRCGRGHSTKEAGYRLYSWLILHSTGPRRFLKRCRMKAARLVKRWLHEK
jgi:hypothetical protein